MSGLSSPLRLASEVPNRCLPSEERDTCLKSQSLPKKSPSARFLAVLETQLTKKGINLDPESKRELHKAINNAGITSSEVLKCFEGNNLVSTIINTLAKNAVRNIRSVPIGNLGVYYPDHPEAKVDQLKYALSSEYRVEVQNRKLVKNNPYCQDSLSNLKDRGLELFARTLRDEIRTLNHNTEVSQRDRELVAIAPARIPPDFRPPNIPSVRSYVRQRW
jgi:hypothetical protein